MSFSLAKVVPWGRSYDEYVAMFALTENDLRKSILGCGDGPVSFNTELTRRGGKIISVDPIYQFSERDIRSQIDSTFHEVMSQTRKNSSEFVWKHIKNTEELGRIRMLAMEKFLEDYINEKKRYIACELPSLPFKDKEFDIALCSHLLFLYSEQLSYKFHIESIKELCRVASEVRIFPLLELGAKKSRHLDKVISILHEEAWNFDIKEVSYEFQKDGNQMLVIKANSKIFKN